MNIEKKSKFANNGTLSPEKKLRQKKHDLKKKYGLSIAEADYLRNQECEICGVKAKKMCIDHKIPRTYRGVLCQQCNTRLGWFEKYREVILEYTERGPQNAIDKINE
jgi:hypothetical protein